MGLREIEQYDEPRRQRAARINKINPAPGQFDWSWMDEALDHLMNKVGCIPIIDLMHYGTPLWMENAFINHAYVERNGEYAYALPNATATWCAITRRSTSRWSMRSSAGGWGNGRRTWKATTATSR